MARDSIPNYLLSLLEDTNYVDRIRILDVGCGRGELMQQIYDVLKQAWPDRKIDIYGLEVLEHAGQKDIYIGEKLDNDNGYDWSDRIKIISDKDDWPFDRGYFDCLVSHSVIEHVRNHDLFFRESYRVLSPEGFAVHSLPVMERLIDGHFRLLWIHRLRDIDLIRKYIEFTSRLGFGKYKIHRQEKDANGTKYTDLKDYVEARTNYAFNRLNYLSIKQVQEFSKKYGFKPSRTRYLLSRFKRRKQTNKTGAYDLSNGFVETCIEYLLSVYIARLANLVFILEK